MAAASVLQGSLCSFKIVFLKFHISRTRYDKRSILTHFSLLGIQSTLARKNMLGSPVDARKLDFPVVETTREKRLRPSISRAVEIFYSSET